MPFDLLPVISKPMKDVLASISYRRNNTKNGRSKNPKLIVGIPKTAMGDFKHKPSQLFSILIGTGDDAGKARIVPTVEGGGVTATLLKGGLVFRFGYVPLLGTDAAEKEFVSVRLLSIKEGGGGFEIGLPPWFKGDSRP